MATSTRRHQLPRRAWAAMARPDGADIPLGALLRVARPAYGGRTWDHAVQYLLDDPIEAEIVTEIADDLLHGRALTDPVRIHRHYRNVRNGMHRITAHVITGSPTIRVTTNSRWSAPLDIIEATLSMTATGSNAHPFDEDTLEEWEPLRSFRLGNTWVENDGVGSCGGLVTGYWYCPHELQDALLDELRARADRYGRTLHVHDVRLTTTDAF